MNIVIDEFDGNRMYLCYIKKSPRDSNAIQCWMSSTQLRMAIRDGHSPIFKNGTYLPKSK